MFLLVVSAVTLTNAQEANFVNQWEIRHDNDFLFFTDRYYSAGSFIGYRGVLENPIFSSSSREQWFVEIGQETFTPTKVKSTVISELDRPYAGYLGVTGGWTLSRKRTHLNTRLSIGIAGPASGAGGFQRWYHDAIVTSAEKPTWIAEISNSLHATFYGMYVYEVMLNPNPFSVTLALAPEIALGTRDIYVAPELRMFFGRRNALAKSIAYNNIGSTDQEIYFSLRGSYKAVFYDGLLQGNLLGDDSVFTTDPERYVLGLGFDFYHRLDRNDYKVSYQYTTKSSSLQESHSYISISYARVF